MGRQYKFRAWDKNNEVMEYGVSVDNGRPVKKGYQLYHTGNTMYHSQLMQFTGLTDKNGREIYEGDIVKYYDHTRDEYVVSPVKWNAPMFVVESGLLFFRSKGADMKFSGEVIGNIYQHKYLLKENN